MVTNFDIAACQTLIFGPQTQVAIYSECCSGLNPDVGHACFGKMLKDGVSNKSKEIS